MCIVRVNKAVSLLAQMGDISILWVRKGDTLLRENGDIYREMVGNIIKLLGEKVTGYIDGT